MKYSNQTNFVLMAAALAFSIYVFSETFMNSGPPADLAQPASVTPASRLDAGASDPEAGVPVGGEAPQERSGTSATDSQQRPASVGGQQAPPRGQPASLPAAGRNRSRSAGDRLRPASRPDRSAPGLDADASGAKLPTGSIIPTRTPSRTPSARRPATPPPSVGSVQDRRPLPLRDRGGSKRRADPDSPPPRGSRQ